mgnify:CR=1 FL=1
MKIFIALIPAFFFTLNTLNAAAAPPTPPKTGPVVVHEIRYTGQLTDDAATFTAALKVESTNTVATALTLFQGELAVIDPKLDDGLRLACDGAIMSLIVVCLTKWGRTRWTIEASRCRACWSPS